MMHNAHLIAHVFLGTEIHLAGPPAAPTPTPILEPHFAGTTIINLGASAKIAETDLGWGGLPLVARGNQAIPAVPHIGPPNPLLVLAIAAGNSRVMFGSSLVKIDVDGAAEDCGCCLYPCVPLSVNQSCSSPCNLPLDRVIAPNTVEVGMTWGDILGGYLETVADTAFSFVAGKVGEKLTEAASGVFARFAPTVAGKAASKYWEYMADFLDKDWAKIAARTEAREAAELWLKTSTKAQFVKVAVETLQRIPGAKDFGELLGGETLPERGMKKMAAGLLGEPDAEGPGEVAHSAGESVDDRPPNSRVYRTDDDAPGVVHTAPSVWHL